MSNAFLSRLPRPTSGKLDDTDAPVLSSVSSCSYDAMSRVKVYSALYGGPTISHICKLNTRIASGTIPRNQTDQGTIENSLIVCGRTQNNVHYNDDCDVFCLFSEIYIYIYVLK